MTMILNQFNKGILQKQGSMIIVQCVKCGAQKQTIYKEHNRNCERLAKYGNNYICYKCLRENERFREFKKQIKYGPEWAEQCRYRSLEASKRISPDEWKRRAIEIANKGGFKKKVSLGIRKKFEDPIYLQKIKEARKKYWQNPEYLLKRKEITRKQQINHEGIFKLDLLKKNTWIERAFFNKCDDLGIKYISHYRIGFYEFDCFLPDYNILVECNGDYHHTQREVNVKNDKTKN